MRALSESFCLRDNALPRSRLVEHHLTHGEGQGLISALPSQPKSNEMDAWRQREACARALRNASSSALLERIRQLRDSEIPALVVKGFPINTVLPPTPPDGFIDINQVSQPLEILLGMFEAMGVSPVGYAGENRDCFIRHVVPSKESLNEVSSHGSLMPLSCHIDNPHLPIGNEPCEAECSAPNYIAWLGLRCDTTVPTSVVLLEDVLSALPAFVVESLKKPSFDILRPPSFGAGAVEHRRAPLLVPDARGALCTRYGFAHPTDAESAYAMELFSLVANDARMAHHVLLPPGDMLIINNQKVLHARNTFVPRYDGTDRWLLRLYGVNQLQSHWMSEHQLPYLVRA
ncbi:putative oxygenase (putative secreted protein) [Cystobacter fuscus DSM 2262]|uniref:Oxygenase (Putative secreted protein) n=1 Tax=Cystobacter fuscus (strain ATCC 25194 / DSM 2262 / NBRC 100088 / M29) TaxID=1242864 RepID=S9QNV4_CYSF2|nr:TauD/TfdA family dioxygenase [Cystobacter fuscus]EPX58228.1 putative oxygenase (putative secreted protein) [Cystobacter fuscus DSM 2262]